MIFIIGNINPMADKLATNNKGLTLIELLITTAIFSIIMVAIVSLFSSVLQTQRNILAAKKVLGQTSYVIEYMVRSLRMAKKDIDGSCLGQAGLNFKSINSGNGVRFINSLQGDDCQEFYLEGGRIKFKKEASSSSPKILDLTSSDISVNYLKFNLSGENQSDNLQPLVTIYLEAKLANSPSIKIQTSVSQRNIDIVQ
jgi:prepilin-type N-terminal cleavage/methylation domain-containing protein